MQTELFSTTQPRSTVSGPRNEAVAELVSHYTLMKLGKMAAANKAFSDRAHRFFGFRERPDDPPNPQWHNLFFLLECYLVEQYGWQIHESFFRLWLDASPLLESKGYNEEERFAAAYSYVADQNLTWMFKLCEFKIEEDRIASAVDELMLEGQGFSE